MVFVTSGDGYPKAAAALLAKPQDELTAEDFARLGEVRESETVAAARVLGLAREDLVFLRYHDREAARLTVKERAHARRAVREALAGSTVGRICIPDRIDEHRDHSATHELVSAALDRFEGEVWTYLVHAGRDVHWPLPGATCEPNTVDGTTYPAGLVWPPPLRVPLTTAQSEADGPGCACFAVDARP